MHKFSQFKPSFIKQLFTRKHKDSTAGLSASFLFISFFLFSITIVNGQSLSITCTGSNGSFKSGSTNGSEKNDGNLINLNSTPSGNRGWATFDLSVIPSGAVINSASIAFTTYSSVSSSSTLNEIHGFTGDPATLPASALYNAIGDPGTNMISANGSWIANNDNSKPLNANGISFLQANISSTKLNIGFLRGSANNYNIAGYPGTDGTNPVLTISYSLPSSAPGCPNGLFPANGATLIPVNSAISWFTTALATSYDIYLGTTTTPPFLTTLPGTANSYPFNPALLANTTYYYKVVPKNLAGEAAGCSTQSFTTSALPVYCTPPSSDCSQDDAILNVSFGTLNNSSSFCNFSGYTDYSAFIGAPVISTTQTLPVSVKVGSRGAEFVGVWIDFNANGTFESSEFTNLGSGTSSNVTGNISVPANAIAGYTKMRVRVKYNSTLTGNDACIAFNNGNFGETEDYLVKIIACNLPVINSISADTIVCTNSTVTLKILNGTLNDATKWQWYTGSCGGTPVGTGNILVVTPAATTTYYVRGEGACVIPVSCNAVKVSVNEIPFPPTIIPISPICKNSIQALEVPGSFPPGPGSSTLSSGSVSIAVPDNARTGATSVINATIPFGAFATGISVKLNLTHTFPGDMIINLKAPNGNILNLYKYNTGTFGDAPVSNAGWYDAKITSSDTTTFSSVPSPYRYGITIPKGPFRPDAINGDVSLSGTVLDVQNPDGFIANVTSFSDLYSELNGTWTLAMADGGAGDIGILTDWSLTINYIIPKGYPAVWSPAATLFTDSAATIPYNGTTPLYKVYARPDTTSVYTALGMNGPCISSATTDIKVIVNNPVSDVVSPANKTICEFSGTTLTTSAKGTNPSYQWLVNTGNGSYNPVTDNVNYTGANSDSLIIKNVPFAWNGYKYRCKITSETPCPDYDTTAAALLRVNPTPSVKFTATPSARLLPGLSDTLSVTAIPAALDFTWYKNGLQLSSATTASLIAGVDDLGDYKVSVTDINGCINTSSVLSVLDSSSGKLFIYPNPSAGNHFQVRYHSSYGNVLPRILILYDSKGAIVYNQRYTITRPYDMMDVNLKQISKGLYFVYLLDINGKRLANGKVFIR